MRQEVIADIERDYIYNLVKQGKRADGRGLDENREISYEINPITSADGSARVKMGNADVIVGVKIGIGSPFNDRPAMGVMMTVAELRPFAYEYFETGPPRPPAIEIARVVDRGIREAGTIDISKLCIEEGEKVWMVFIDIHAINFDGNLIAAAGLAGTLALKNATVPAEQYDVGENFPLPVVNYPIPVTSVKLRHGIVVDPTAVEEVVADARITTTFDENGDLRAMQKGHGGSFTRQELTQIIETNAKVSNNIRDLVGLKQ